MEALRVFETPRPAPGAKFRAVRCLLFEGVPEKGIRALIDTAPWGEDNRAKWRMQLVKIARKKRDAMPADHECVDPYDLLDAKQFPDVFAFAAAVSRVREWAHRG